MKEYDYEYLEKELRDLYDYVLTEYKDDSLIKRILSIYLYVCFGKVLQ